MNTYYKLAKGKTLHLKKETTVHLTNGIVWLTYANDYNDYFFKEGDQIKIENDNYPVIQAMDDVTITIDSGSDNLT